MIGRSRGDAGWRRRLAGLAVAVGAVLALAGPATAAPLLGPGEDGPVRRLVSSQILIGTSTLPDGGCVTGASLHFAALAGATSYDISYWDGYRQDIVRTSAPPFEDTADHAAGMHRVGIAGAFGACGDPGPTEAYYAGRLNRGSTVYAIFPPNAKPPSIVSGSVMAPHPLLNPPGATVPRGVEGAVVRIGGRSARTNAYGFYTLKVPRGTYRVSAEGYCVAGGKGPCQAERTVKAPPGGVVNFVTGPPAKVSGTITRLECAAGACRSVPVEGVTVGALRSDVLRAMGVSGSDGTYVFELPSGGIWTIAPQLPVGQASLPRDRRITSEPGVERAGVDFEVCNPTVPLGSPLPPCVPTFTTSVAPRIDMTGEPTVHPASAFQPAELPVRFTIRDGACDTTATYRWFVGADAVQARPVGPCVFELPFTAEGSYRVRVEQVPSGATSSVSGGEYADDVMVQDFVIASLGDSAASGEGNPPFTDGIGVSTCHRSPTAFGAQAAQGIEDDPRSSVTFVHLACTGARLQGGILNGDIGYQLARLKALVGTREIDALHLTIGINDLDFASYLYACTAYVRCQRSRITERLGIEDSLIVIRGGRAPTYGQVLARAMSRLPAKLTGLQEQIRKRFPTSQLPASHIYLSGYPDPLHDQKGRLCEVLLGTSRLGFREDEGEVSWAERELVVPLQGALRAAALRRGWTFVDSADRFDRHGYCSSSSWFRSVSPSISRFNPSGIFHPDAAGHEAMKIDLLARLKADLLPGGRPRAPG